MLRTPSFFVKLMLVPLVSKPNRAYIKVLGVKHSCKIKLMQQIVGNCPTNHLAVGI